MRRRVCVLGVGGALMPLHGLRAQVQDLNDAINKAGRQRMLSQRMSKAWLALGQNVEPARAERVLGESIAWFDRQLAELKTYAPLPDIRATYLRMEPVWGEFKGALVGRQPSASAATALLALDAQLLALAQQGTQQFEAHAGRPLGHLVNLAGRQRMLSQRMARAQLALGWQAGSGLREQISSARSEFIGALDTLARAPETGAAIQAELSLARQQWIFFDHALARAAQAGPREAAEVFIASENILQVMDRVTGLYARQSG